MDRVDIASESEKSAVLEYLESRGLVDSAWLMWWVSDTLDAPAGANWKVLVCRRDGGMAGVARVLMVDDGWTTKPAYDYQVELDAEDDSAAASLLRACPVGLGEFLPDRSGLQPCFAALDGAKERLGDLYYTVSRESFKSVPHGEIRELTEADAGLFEGREHTPNWENLTHGARLFAIVRDGRVACSLLHGQLGPVAPSGRRVMTIGALHTETPCRRQGLARQLVSFATEMALREGDVPMYWTGPENVASQALCQGLGYRQYWQRNKYLWRREA